MAVELTQRTMRGYLDALLHGGDFGAFFTEDVLWTTMETGERIRGRQAVTDFIVALHTEQFAAAPELRSITYADGVAGLEAVFAGRHVAEFAGIPATGIEVRLPYTVFYSLSGELISELRAYFPILALVAQLKAGSAISA